LISFEIGAALVLASLSEAFLAPPIWGNHHFLSSVKTSSTGSRNNPIRPVVTVLFADTNQEPDLDNGADTAAGASSSDDSNITDVIVHISDSIAEEDADSEGLNDANTYDFQALTTEEEEKVESTKDDNKSTFEKSLEESLSFVASQEDEEKKSVSTICIATPTSTGGIDWTGRICYVLPKEGG
jgi:hypothetical protein